MAMPYRRQVCVAVDGRFIVADTVTIHDGGVAGAPPDLTVDGERVPVYRRLALEVDGTQTFTWVGPPTDPKDPADRARGQP